MACEPPTAVGSDAQIVSARHLVGQHGEKAPPVSARTPQDSDKHANSACTTCMQPSASPASPPQYQANPIQLQNKGHQVALSTLYEPGNTARHIVHCDDMPITHGAQTANRSADGGDPLGANSVIHTGWRRPCCTCSIIAGTQRPVTVIWPCRCCQRQPTVKTEYQPLH